MFANDAVTVAVPAWRSRPAALSHFSGSLPHVARATTRQAARARARARAHTHAGPRKSKPKNFLFPLKIRHAHQKKILRDPARLAGHASASRETDAWLILLVRGHCTEASARSYALTAAQVTPGRPQVCFAALSVSPTLRVRAGARRTSFPGCDGGVCKRGTRPDGCVDQQQQSPRVQRRACETVVLHLLVKLIVSCCHARGTMCAHTHARAHKRTHAHTHAHRNIRTRAHTHT